jgi:uncharacterized protein YbaP (TraB family)
MKTALRNSGVRLLLAIIFFSGTLHAQEKKSEKALLWKISGNGLLEPSYLFGTYHLLGAKFLTEVPETEQPFANAKGVVVELVIDSSKMISVMMSKSIMQDKKISTLLSPQDFQRIDSALGKLSGYSLKTFDMFKPAQVGMMIGLFQAQTLNADLLKKYEGVPLDIHFASAAKKAGKTVTPLETMEQQFDVLYNHFAVEEQAKQLVEMVKQSELTAKASVEMTKHYFEKDVDALGVMMESFPEELTGNMDHMLKNRNVNWIKVLPALMKSGSQFIAVGAGHLPGSDGLIALLRKEGYTVTPVSK